MKMLAKSIEKELLTHSTYQKMKKLYPYLPTTNETVALCDDDDLIVSLTGDFEQLKADWLDRPIKAFMKQHPRCYHKSPILSKEIIIGYRYLFTPKNTEWNRQKVGLVSNNKKYQTYIQRLKLSATTSLPIYIFGETGSGKEVAAKNIHHLSEHREGPFIAVNCGAIHPDLLESELFGYAPGAFTGAKNNGFKGKFAQANHGTLFLDEIDSMPRSMQVALLRVLEEKIVTPLGSEHGSTTDFRLITASNCDLKQLASQKKFRQDLFYRIYGLPLQLPALRERPEDFTLLIEQFSKEKNWQPSWLTEITKELVNYSWYGNIREFNYFLERLFLFYPLEQPSKKDLDDLIAMGTLDPQPTTSVLSEKEKISLILEQENGNITKTAEVLGMGRSTLYRKFKKYNMRY